MRSFIILACMVAFVGVVDVARAAPELGGQDESSSPTAIAAMRQTGVKVVRVIASTNDDQATTDQRIAAIHAAGMRPLITVWASHGNVFYPTAASSPDEYAAYAGSIARRYGPGLYSVGNEPDIFSAASSLSFAARQYARQFRAAAKAIRQAAPGSRVLVGETSPRVNVPKFIRALVKTGVLRYADGYAHHAYTWAWCFGGAKLPELRKLIGDRIPLYVTEFAAESKRALKSFFRAADKANVRLAVWFQWSKPTETKWDTHLVGTDMQATFRSLGR